MRVERSLRFVQPDLGQYSGQLKVLEDDITLDGREGTQGTGSSAP